MKILKRLLPMLLLALVFSLGINASANSKIVKDSDDKKLYEVSLIAELLNGKKDEATYARIYVREQNGKDKEVENIVTSKGVTYRGYFENEVKIMLEAGTYYIKTGVSVNSLMGKLEAPKKYKLDQKEYKLTVVEDGHNEIILKYNEIVSLNDFVKPEQLNPIFRDPADCIQEKSIKKLYFKDNVDVKHRTYDNTVTAELDDKDVEKVHVDLKEQAGTYKIPINTDLIPYDIGKGVYKSMTVVFTDDSGVLAPYVTSVELVVDDSFYWTPVTLTAKKPYIIDRELTNLVFDTRDSNTKFNLRETYNMNKWSLNINLSNRFTSLSVADLGIKSIIFEYSDRMVSDDLEISQDDYSLGGNIVNSEGNKVVDSVKQQENKTYNRREFELKLKDGYVAIHTSTNATDTGEQQVYIGFSDNDFVVIGVRQISDTSEYYFTKDYLCGTPDVLPLYLVKQSKSSYGYNTPLEGALFDIEGFGGRKIKNNLKTDSEGKIDLTFLYEDECWNFGGSEGCRIIETKAPDGYDLVTFGGFNKTKVDSQDIGYKIELHRDNYYYFTIDNGRATVPEKPNIVDPNKPGIPNVPEIVGKDKIIVKAPEYSVGCNSLDIRIPKNTSDVRYSRFDFDGYIEIRAFALDNKVFDNDYLESIKDSAHISGTAYIYWRFNLPDVEECEIEVTPEIPEITNPDKPGTEVPIEENNGIISPEPSYKLDCDGKLEVTLPTTEGVEYIQSQDGKYIIVTASAKEGYVIKDGSIVEWKFELITSDVCVTPEIPEIINPDKPGEKVPTEEEDGVISAKPEYKLECGKGLDIRLPEVKGITYTKTEQDGYIIVKAIAEKGYEIKGETEWKFNLPEIEECDIEITPVEPEKPNIVNPNKPEVEENDINLETTLPMTGNYLMFLSIISISLLSFFVVVGLIKMRREY